MKLLPNKKEKKSHFSFRYLLDHAVTGIELVDVGNFSNILFRRGVICVLDFS